MIDPTFVPKLLMDNIYGTGLLTNDGPTKLYVLDIASMGKGSADILFMENCSIVIFLIGDGLDGNLRMRCSYSAL